MTGENMSILKKFLAYGTEIVWMPDSSTARKVIRIGKHAEEGESECAIFSNGEYAALYNCALSDFFEVKTCTTETVSEALQSYANSWQKAYDKVAKERDKYKQALIDIQGCGVRCTDGICPASKIAKQELRKK